jgi:predicted ABC-type ATPase
MELHARIVKETIGAVPVQKPLEGGKLEAIFLMGGPGAGKSTVKSQILGASAKDYVDVAPDDVKEKLPEYQLGLSTGDKGAANRVQGESAMVASSILQAAAQSERKLIYDGTGQVAATYLDNITQLQKQGYRVKVVMVHIDVETALKRVRGRGLETGRAVPEDVVRKVYDVAPKNFPEIAAKANDAELYDNTGAGPVLVYSKAGGDSIVHIPQFLYQHGMQGVIKVDYAALDANLYGNLLGPLTQDVAGDDKLAADVAKIVVQLDAARKLTCKDKKIPTQIALRGMPNFKAFAEFCIGNLSMPSSAMYHQLFVASSAAPCLAYLKRYCAAVKQARQLGLLSDQGKLSFLHGTHSGTAALVTKTTCKLMPFGELLKCEVYPVSGELSGGIKTLNNKKISGMAMNSDGLKKTVGYATDSRYKFDLEAARKEGSLDNLKRLIAEKDTVTNFAQPESRNAYELGWDRLRIALYRRKLMDNDQLKTELSAFHDLLEGAAHVWAMQGDPISKVYGGFIGETFRVLDRQPVDLGKDGRQAVELAFPVVFASTTLKPKPVIGQVTGEVSHEGSAAFAQGGKPGDVQYAFTNLEHVTMLNAILQGTDIRGLSFDVAHAALHAEGSPYKEA